MSEAYQIKHPIVKHYAGSIAYGTNLPTSDVDIRGIFCAEEHNIRTPFYPVYEIDIPNEEDGKLYELSNFLGLYLKGNPNILETLWVEESDIIENSDVYSHLRTFREELLSSNVAFRFSGYAFSQLEKIKSRNKWINNPQPKQPPMHKDYIKLIQNFTPRKILPKDFNFDYLRGHSIVHYGSNIFGVLDGHEGGVSAITSGGDFNISAKQIKDCVVECSRPKYIIKYLYEEYKQDKERHHNYWEWKTNRNEVRSELESKYGYDTKNAMHLVRLLRMGEEALTGQGIIVKRPDAKELLDVRNGLWDYNDLVKWAEDKDKYIKKTLLPNTKLRKKPNLKLAAKCLIDCQDMCWRY